MIIDRLTKPRPLLAALWIVFIIGCAGKATTYPARGTVTFPDGKPLAGAVVTLRSISHERPVTARGRTNAGGTFTLSTFKPDDGALAGQHQAIVAVPVVESDGPFAKPPVDPRFSDYVTSGLEFTVSEDPEQNRFEIVVTPPQTK